MSSLAGQLRNSARELEDFNQYLESIGRYLKAEL